MEMAEIRDEATKLHYLDLQQEWVFKPGFDTMFDNTSIPIEDEHLW
jgi:hypothetical protein